MLASILFEPTGIKPAGGMTAASVELAALNAAALLLFLFVVAAWGRHGNRRFVVGGGVLTLLVVVLAYVGAVQPRDIPTEWITIIHEGLGYKSINHLYTTAVHAGVNFAFVAASVAAGSGPTLHDVVWLNVLLALVNAVIFFWIACYVTGPIWACAWTLVLALNPATFQASFSELPTNLIGFYLLAGFVAWVALVDSRPQPFFIRAMAYVLCAVLTLLVGLTRSDVAMIGVIALAGHAFQALVRPDARSAAASALSKIGERILVFVSDHPWLIAAACVLSIYLSQSGLPGGVLGRSEAAGLYPFNPSFLTLYIFLPMLLLPIGVSIAVFFGFIHAAVRFWSFGGLALSLFILVRTYFAAQNQYYETGRYFSFILPAVFLLGLFGKQQLEAMIRGWRPNWVRIARVVYLMAWFTRPPPGTPNFYLPLEYVPEAGFSQVFLNYNTQREVRHLLTLTEANPQCVFVGRVIVNNNERPAQYGYAVFGLPVPSPILVRESEASLDEVIARYAKDASCVRLYYGGDCNITYTDHCKQFVEGRRLIDEKRFWSRPYGNTPDFGYGEPEIVLATYAWP